MKGYNKFLILLVAFFFVGLLPIKTIRADEKGKNIIVLIDNSGSMDKNDNTRLSLVSASMLIDTIDLNNSKINVIAFGDKVTYVKRLSEKPTAEELKSHINTIKYDNQYTNMKEGLKEALAQLKDVEGDKSIIVLSDGKEEVPGESKEEHEKKLNTLIKTAQDMNVVINTIGLSKDSDKNALSDIANKTLGDYFFVENAAGVFDVFSKILGNINGYYTIDGFSTNIGIDKSIKISPFVDEIVVNVLSTNEDFPTVNVSNENNVNFEYKSGDRYKIYRLKNDNSGRANSIRISAAAGEKASVIVQIKSKVDILVNTSSDSFEIPYKVPMNIEALVKADKDISDLQLYQIDEGEKKLLKKENNIFNFQFKKDKPGYYPVFLIACDGSGNVIAGKYFNIAVTSNIPFSFSSQLPKFIYGGNDLEISLKQQDETKIRDVAGDIYLWYEGAKEPKIFPLKFEAGNLSAKVKLKEVGKIKLFAQIRGIKEEGDEPFFYYLPAINSEVVEKPIIEFKSEKYKRPFKEREEIQLEILITNNKLNKEETMLLYDSNNKLLHEFTVKPGESRVSIALGAAEKGENYKFIIEAKNPELVRVEGEISTNIRVISALGYFWYKFKLLIFILIALLLLSTAFVLLCLNKYRNEIEDYSVNKDIEVSIGANGITQGEIVTLGTGNTVAYLNVNNNSVYLSSDEVPDNSIGYFVLKMPQGNKIIQGLNYLLKGEEMFEISYRAITEQNTLEGSPVSEMTYRENQEIIANSITGNKTIKIYFY